MKLSVFSWILWDLLMCLLASHFNWNILPHILHLHLWVLFRLWILLMWVIRLGFVVKVSSHTSHLSLIPWWMLKIWCCKPVLPVKRLWQSSHWNFDISSWTVKMCLCRLLWFTKIKSHLSHLQSRVILWTVKQCLLRILNFWNLSSQILQLKSFGSILSWFLLMCLFKPSSLA